nr:SHOCT domain-containing protein [Streptomyces sp. NBC_00886]
MLGGRLGLFPGALAHSRSPASGGRTHAPGANRADELAKLAGLHDHGDITDAEYERAKAKVFAA